METLISFSTGVCHTTMQADLSVWLFNLLYMSHVSRNSQILKIMFPSRNDIHRQHEIRKISSAVQIFILNGNEVFFFQGVNKFL